MEQLTLALESPAERSFDDEPDTGAETLDDRVQDLLERIARSDYDPRTSDWPEGF